jgi:hypothetical protein
VTRSTVVVAAAVMAVCLLRTTSPHTHELRTLALVTVGLLAVPMAVGSWRVWEGFRLERALRARSADGLLGGLAVRWLDAPSPFVAGLWRPAIYVPRDVEVLLAPGELHAVLLHEEHHRRQMAPRRLLVLELIDSLLPIRRVRHIIESERATLEIEADRAALAAGATRRALAAALLKLPALAAPTAAGFGAATEIRLAHLLDGDVAPSEAGGRSRGAVVRLSMVLAVVACLVASLA